MRIGTMKSFAHYDSKANVPARLRVSATALGWILIVAGGANGHKLLAAPPYGVPQTWSSLALVQFELALGGWFLSGWFPRGARATGLVVFTAALFFNIVEVGAHRPPSHGLGRIVISPWWLIGAEFLTVFVLKFDRTPSFEIRPLWLIGMAFIGSGVGFLADQLQYGQTPIVGEFHPVADYVRASHNYLVYLPNGYYRSQETWPLLLFLHDIDAVGQDVSLVKGAGLPRLIETGKNIPFIVLAPQSNGRGWNIGAVNDMLTYVIRYYRIDERRLYLTGVGMGGYAAWSLAEMEPERFAAIAPVSGGGNPGVAARLNGVPTWIFHGAADQIIPVDKSRAMVEAQRQAGGVVKFTIYPDQGHDAWQSAFDDPDLYVWLLSHRLARKSDRLGGRYSRNRTDDITTCEGSALVNSLPHYSRRLEAMMFVDPVPVRLAQLRPFSYIHPRARPVKVAEPPWATAEA